MATRVVLVVCGSKLYLKEQEMCKKKHAFQVVDVAMTLPRDPGAVGQRGDSRDLVQGVVEQHRFVDVVQAVVVAAGSGHVLVRCRAGLHRSPVVAAVSAQVQG
jgi:hypothetical protein